MLCVYNSRRSYRLFRFYFFIFEMPKYAVAKGRKVGIYDSWAECEKLIKGFIGAKYKRFDTQQQAENFIKESTGVSPIKPVEQIISSSGSFENLYSDEAFPVTRISPSNPSLNELNKSFHILDTKLSSFMKHVNATFDDIKKRLSAIEERNIIGDQTCRLEAENKKIAANSNGRKAVKRKATPVSTILNDENDDDFINLVEYDEENKSHGKNKKSSLQTTNTNNAIPKQKATKLPKCKIIDEVDGYYGISQCVVDSRGFLINPFGAVVAYTDGACTRNGKIGAKAGIGVWFNHNHPRNVSEPVRGRATNNNAEIQAATAAILQAAKEGIRYVHIYTDSQFLINCITTWIYKWKYNNWRTVENKPVINKVELVELDNSINEFMDHVVWTYVKGHSGDIGNSAADELARKGAKLYRCERE